MKPADLVGAPVWVMAKGYLPDEGGMQTYAQGVAEAYAAAGASVTVFTQTSAGPRRERVGNVLLIDIGAGKSASVPLRFLRAMPREMRRTGRPLFTHGTTWRTSALPMVMRLPYVTTFHGREFMYAKGVAYRLMRMVAARANRFVAVSEYSAERLRQRLGRSAPPALVAWNGLSLGERPLPAKSADGDVPLIFSLCRLEPRKNIVACVKACAAMRDRGYGFRYIIGGRGPDLAAVTAAVAEHRLSDCVEVAGFVAAERVAQLYAQADIFLHPQVAGDDGRDFEGFGIAIADAMIAQGAVIVGAEGGAKELIRDGETGFVVDGSDPSQIEGALEELLANPVGRRGMAVAAHDHAAEYFSWERHIGAILAEVRLND